MLHVKGAKNKQGESFNHIHATVCRLGNMFAQKSEIRCSHQTHAGDAGVVGDVGDVEDFSFVLTAGLSACEGQQEGDKGEMKNGKNGFGPTILTYIITA